MTFSLLLCPKENWISRPCHLEIMKELVQTQWYLTLVANHRTTNQAEIYTISTCKHRQIRAILWSLLPPRLLHSVLANYESVPLQAKYTCILLIQISLRIIFRRFSFFIIPPKLSNEEKTHSMYKQLCFESRHRTLDDVRARQKRTLSL